jgi:hypothetical protein
MAKLPLTRPLYMAELGKRMGLPTREARRCLRRIEHSRKVKLLFKSTEGEKARFWTTESLLAKYYPELVDKPRRAAGEVRQFVKRVSEKFDEIEREMGKLKAQQEEEVGALRAQLRRHAAEGHR